MKCPGCGTSIDSWSVCGTWDFTENVTGDIKPVHTPTRCAEKSGVKGLVEALEKIVAADREKQRRRGTAWSQHPSAFTAALALAAYEKGKS